MTNVCVDGTDAVARTRPNVVRRFFRNRAWKRLVANRVALASLIIIVTLILMAVFADLIARHDPNAQDLRNTTQGPSWDHWLGTDRLGRDILSRLLIGCRVTLMASFQGLFVACLLGIPLGLIAGYVGRWVDGVLNWISDALLALPFLIFAMAIIGMLGPGLRNAMIAIGIVLSPRFFRLARAAAQVASKEVFAEAARADGASASQILWRHILPNSAGPLLIQITFGIGIVIGAEAGLSFLGLGAQLPTASWGSMIGEAFLDISTDAWPMMPPTIAIVVTVGASFLLGDGLRDAIGRDNSIRD
jgi:peptide/nickel transport system permease protein